MVLAPAAYVILGIMIGVAIGVVYTKRAFSSTFKNYSDELSAQYIKLLKKHKIIDE